MFGVIVIIFDSEMYPWYLWVKKNQFAELPVNDDHIDMRPLHVSLPIFVHVSYTEGCSENENNCYFHAIIFPALITLCFVLFIYMPSYRNYSVTCKINIHQDRFQHLSKCSVDEAKVLPKKKIRKKRTSGAIYVWRPLPETKDMEG